MNNNCLLLLIFLFVHTKMRSHLKIDYLSSFLISFFESCYYNPSFQMGNVPLSEPACCPPHLQLNKSDEPPLNSIQNIQNEEPTDLASRISIEFKKMVIASKNIMMDKHFIGTKPIHAAKSQRQSIRTDQIDINQITFSLQDKMLAPIFQVFTRMKVKRPAFEMIQIDLKKFLKLKVTPIIDDYELICEVGKGGFGSVYKARQKKTKELRAVKKIKKQAMDKEQQLSLMNQFQILSGMDHPNIIKLYDIYDDESNFYVVTELCEGGNLLNFINSEKISENTMRNVMLQLLSAVRYMHSFKILHRDIKLENIVLVKKLINQDEKMQIKLIDFGISVNLNKTSSNEQPMGTLLYMAPQSLGDNLELASDIWSCGIALYMLATRKVPYNYKSDDELMLKIQKGDIIRKNMQSLSVDLKMFIAQLLEKKSKRRINASTAIQCGWIKKQLHKFNISQSKMTKAAKDLLDYDAKNNLVSIIESYIVFKKINQDERQRLALVFEQIDKDKSGIIQIEQFKRFYSEHSQHYDAKEVQELLNVMDKNKSGKIDFNQFIIAMYNRRKLFQLHSLQQAFDYFDKDKSGEISKKQLQFILQGIKLEEVEYLFAELDKNHDQKISKTEFLTYLGNYQNNSRQSMKV